MTTCKKAQANTSRPEEARLILPDPGLRQMEPRLLACLPSSCLSDSSSFLASSIKKGIPASEAVKIKVPIYRTGFQNRDDHLERAFPRGEREEPLIYEKRLADQNSFGMSYSCLSFPVNQSPTYFRDISVLRSSPYSRVASLLPFLPSVQFEPVPEISTFLLQGEALPFP
ncbi:hypothetical protein ACFE04_021674 [Oxalis oulophora]